MYFDLESQHQTKPYPIFVATIHSLNYFANTVLYKMPYFLILLLIQFISESLLAYLRLWANRIRYTLLCEVGSLHSFLEGRRVWPNHSTKIISHTQSYLILFFESIESLQKYTNVIISYFALRLLKHHKKPILHEFVSSMLHMVFDFQILTKIRQNHEHLQIILLGDIYIPIEFSNLLDNIDTIWPADVIASHLSEESK
ncbi:hypothetical protein AGLY_010077 [Aphis glycines]|uniref:Uncharacterized protein n=1 Tax=Aphis glycines TaxID=307491 RepID=A0A6G0TFD3_APHGL|nr:hypothetical protein AGLY_010077 [Aphis glycines]